MDALMIASLIDMGNSLLDFVVALVRDPAAAARYAADPAGTLADAHLPGITVADVDNLIPVVADSLAAATPMFGAMAEAANVWTSGAAAAAFDAFDIHIPGSQVSASSQAESPAVAIPAAHSASDPRVDLPPVDVLPVIDVPPGSLGDIDRSFDEITPDWPDGSGWQHPHGDPLAGHHPTDAGFDLG